MVTIRLERNIVTPDKKPSASEDFSTKFSRRVKKATSVVTSSPATPVTYIFKYGDGLAHIPKMRCSSRENKPVVISISFSALLPLFAYVLFISPLLVSSTRAPPLFDSGHLSCFPLIHGVTGNLPDCLRPMAASTIDRTPPATAASASQ
jgi:hypothetical protein